MANWQKPIVGAGVEAGLVGLMKTSGAEVVTYNGWPLYTYVADVQPGSASGEGIDLNGGAWYLMRPDGIPLVPAGQPALEGAAPEGAGRQAWPLGRSSAPSVTKARPSAVPAAPATVTGITTMYLSQVKTAVLVDNRKLPLYIFLPDDRR